MASVLAGIPPLLRPMPKPRPHCDEEDLHRVKYPVGSRIEVVPLADGQMLVVVKKKVIKQMTIDTKAVVTQ